MDMDRKRTCRHKDVHMLTCTHIHTCSDKTVGAPDGSVLKLTAAEVTHTLKGLIL